MNKSNVPNLDCFVDPEDVWSLYRAWYLHPRLAAQELFPDRPRHYVMVTKNLTNYAANKATAMRCRLEGDIATATIYETICEKIYNNLPQYARW